MPDETVSVRYMVDDVASAVAFYTAHFGFTPRSTHPPSPMCGAGSCGCSSAVRPARPVDRWPTAPGPRRAAGTAST